MFFDLSNDLTFLTAEFSKLGAELIAFPKKTKKDSSQGRRAFQRGHAKNAQNKKDIRIEVNKRRITDDGPGPSIHRKRKKVLADLPRLDTKSSNLTSMKLILSRLEILKPEAIVSLFSEHSNRSYASEIAKSLLAVSARIVFDGELYSKIIRSIKNCKSIPAIKMLTSTLVKSGSSSLVYIRDILGAKIAQRKKRGILEAINSIAGEKTLGNKKKHAWLAGLIDFTKSFCLNIENKAKTRTSALSFLSKHCFDLDGIQIFVKEICTRRTTAENKKISTRALCHSRRRASSSVFLLRSYCNEFGTRNGIILARTMAKVGISYKGKYDLEEVSLEDYSPTQFTDLLSKALTNGILRIDEFRFGRESVIIDSLVRTSLRLKSPGQIGVLNCITLGLAV
jgi:hypothetical protein